MSRGALNVVRLKERMIAEDLLGICMHLDRRKSIGVKRNEATCLLYLVRQPARDFRVIKGCFRPKPMVALPWGACMFGNRREPDLARGQPSRVQGVATEYPSLCRNPSSLNDTTKQGAACNVDRSTLGLVADGAWGRLGREQSERNLGGLAWDRCQALIDVATGVGCVRWLFQRIGGH